MFCGWQKALEQYEAGEKALKQVENNEKKGKAETSAKSKQSTRKENIEAAFAYFSQACVEQAGK